MTTVTEREQGVRAAFGLLVVGFLMAAYGFRMYQEPLAMLPGLDGTMIVGPLTFGLAMLHGLSYRNALNVLMPIVAVQAGVCLLHRAAWPAILGVEAIVIGLVGVILYVLSQPAAEAAEATEPARARVTA